MRSFDSIVVNGIGMLVVVEVDTIILEVVGTTSFAVPLTSWVFGTATNEMSDD